MKTFEIYHPIGKMNHVANVESLKTFTYKKVGEVLAENIYAAFKEGQNFNPSYAILGVRSTSVGDIIKDANTDETNLVLGLGEVSINSNQWITNG